jgi:IS5 family transposase
MNAAYARLIGLSKDTGAQALKVLEVLSRKTEPKARQLALRIGVTLPLLMRVIRQATRRVVDGAAVPTGEKLSSLFELHTQIVPRFKADTAVEFARKIRLGEVEGGLVTGYSIVKRGGGQDRPRVAEALANHTRLFGRAPRLLACDRGLSSAKSAAGPGGGREADRAPVRRSGVLRAAPA